MNKNVRTSRYLAKKLDELFDGLRNGKIDPKTGVAMAKAAEVMMDVAQIEAQFGASVILYGTKEEVVYDPASKHGNPRFK